jgi:hypothetical protein
VISSPFDDVEIPDQPLTDHVLGRAAELGDKPALIEVATGRTITYEGLAGAVRAMAAGLSELGFGKGDVFAHFAPNVPEYAVAFHGAASAGGVNTTANPLLTAQELGQQLTDSGARCSPIVTPLVTTTFAPHHTLSPMRVGPFEVKPCHVTGRAGSSKRWLPSVTKQPLASMQWLPISTSAVEATMTPMLRNVPSPIRTRASPGAVIHTFGSSSVPAPISRRPSRSASSTFPCTGQRTNASRRANSQWIRARSHGIELRSYQRHFRHHSRARRTSMGASWRENDEGSGASRHRSTRALRSKRGGPSACSG